MTANGRKQSVNCLIKTGAEKSFCILSNDILISVEGTVQNKFTFFL